jgi:hypothetical protein
VLYMEPPREMHRMKGRSLWSIASLFGVSLCSVSCGGGSGGAQPSPGCDPLTNYTASSTMPLSFATDILPILSGVTSCGAGGICHGDPPMQLTSSGKTLQFGPQTGGVMNVSAAMVKAALLGPSVNAPSMSLVVPGNVGASFLAHKISGMDALTCIQTNCTAHATIGTNPPAPAQLTPCGDPMPRPGGMLSAADKTKILDWIKQGAAD